MTTTTNTQSFYSTMSNQNDRLFHDEQIQRFDADTIKNRYGSSWKNFASNVREIAQPDGSIVKEYIIEDPSLLEEIKPSSGPMTSSSPPMVSDDEKQQSLKNKFAQIKAKFEQKNVSNVMATPTLSSVHSGSSSTTATRQNSRKQMDDLYARHRRASNESIPVNRIENDSRNSIGYSTRSSELQNNYRRSQSIGSERTKASSFRRFDSADEADEEVRRIHRQGEELRRHNHELTPPSALNQMPQQSNVQYEVVDEDGNPMSINGVQDLIKMSGVRAREVPQPDGTIIKEYVIDDPQLLSQFRSQEQQSPMNSSYIQQQQSAMSSSYNQQRGMNENAPPPPPRVPLRPPLLRQGSSSMNDNLPYNIQQIHVLEPQRRYEYLTTTGQRIQFFITNSDNLHGQSITDPDIRELSNAINNRLLPTSNSIIQQQQPSSSSQVQYNQPKQWYPSVDIKQRQRLGSDTQPYSNNSNIAFQQQQPVFSEPVNNWNKFRHQDSNNQRHQTNEPFQSSAQFLPQQQIRTSPMNNNHQPTISYQQSINYPFQGQQQHGVRILHDFNHQQSAITADGHTRI